MKKQILETLNNLDNLQRSLDGLAILATSSDSDSEHVGFILSSLSISIENELDFLYKLIKRKNLK